MYKGLLTSCILLVLACAKPTTHQTNPHLLFDRVVVPAVYVKRYSPTAKSSVDDEARIKRETERLDRYNFYFWRYCWYGPF